MGSISALARCFTPSFTPSFTANCQNRIWYSKQSMPSFNTHCAEHAQAPHRMHAEAMPKPLLYAPCCPQGFVWAFLSGISEPVGGLLGYLVLQDNQDLAFAIVFGLVAGEVQTRLD